MPFFWGDDAQMGFLVLPYPVRRWVTDLGFMFPEVARQVNLATSWSGVNTGRRPLEHLPVLALVFQAHGGRKADLSVTQRG